MDEVDEAEREEGRAQPSQAGKANEKKKYNLQNADGETGLKVRPVHMYYETEFPILWLPEYLIKHCIHPVEYTRHTNIQTKKHKFPFLC